MRLRNSVKLIRLRLRRLFCSHKHWRITKFTPLYIRRRCRKCGEEHWALRTALRLRR